MRLCLRYININSTLVIFNVVETNLVVTVFKKLTRLAKKANYLYQTPNIFDLRPITKLGSFLNNYCFVLYVYILSILT